MIIGISSLRQFCIDHAVYYSWKIWRKESHTPWINLLPLRSWSAVFNIVDGIMKRAGLADTFTVARVMTSLLHVGLLDFVISNRLRLGDA